MSNESELVQRKEKYETTVFIKKDLSENTKSEGEDLIYGIEDAPPWYFCILMGLQQFLMMYGVSITIPFVLFPILCAHGDRTVLVWLIGTLSFVSGIATILQTAIGIRLPMVQGGTFSFLVPTVAILSLPKWTCSSVETVQVNTTISNLTTTAPEVLDDEDWKLRIREVKSRDLRKTIIQGAVLVASCFEVLVPLSGILGFLLRYVGPLTIAPTITLIGVALFETAANYSGKHWYIAIATMVLITIFSQYLEKFAFTMKLDKQIKGQKVTTETKIPVFTLYPVLLAMAVSWIICVILTVTNVLPDDPSKWGYDARTDIKSYLIREASWFRIPYPGQWGTPTVSVGAVIGILAGILASMVESIGDYYACAKLCGLPPPPTHAINRGLFMEGVSGILSGAWGSGNGTTSYSPNIGAIGLTKVASRRVIYVCGVFLLLSGSVLKFSALVASLPEPILGGSFMVLFGMVVSVGLSNLQYVNISSSRTSFIVGTSLLFGLGFPFWMSKYGKIDTGNLLITLCGCVGCSMFATYTHVKLLGMSRTGSCYIFQGVDELDQIFTVICSTSMFIGGLVGFILDNTIPGTKKERGLLAWQIVDEDKQSDMSAYDIPFVQNYIDRSWLRYLPILSSRRNYKKNEDNVESSHL